MLATKFIFLVPLVCLVTTALPQNEDIAEKSTELKESTAGIDKFTEKLTRTLFTHASANDNVIFSPVNVYSALTLLLFGAAGDTLKEIATALGFHYADEKFLSERKNFGELFRSLAITKNESDVLDCKKECTIGDVSFANGVFLQKNHKLILSYIEDLKFFFNGTAENVDFKNDAVGATNRINKWIAEKSHNLIPKLLKEPVQPSVELMLASTVYFSAKWRMNTFKRLRSKPEKFFIDGGSIDVEYIYNENRISFFNDSNTFCAISLPYQGNDYETLFVLPNANISINSLAETFSIADFHKILKESKMKYVNYRIPYIDTRWSGDLIEPLKSLNLVKIFQSANLTKMVPESVGSLYVSKITHAAKVKMDEKGTVASGATTIEISLRSGKVRSSINFIANRPYFFFIYHKSSSVILFSALIQNPLLIE